MIQISRRHSVMLMLLILSTYILTGVYSLVISDSPAGSDGNVIRFFGEKILFISIVSMTAVSLLFLYVYRRSRNVIRELGKTIELNKDKNYSPLGNLERMGELGKKVTGLLSQINEQSERKSLKISAQTGIIEFLLRNIQIPLIILDITGRIVNAGSRYTEITLKQHETIEGSTIERLIPGMEFHEVLSELLATHTSAVRDYGQKHIVFTPIFNRNNEISNIVCTFGREAVRTGPVFSTQDARPAPKRPKGFMRNIFDNWKPPQ